MELFGSLVEEYVEFATYARGESDCLAEWSSAIAEDEEVLAWLAGFPGLKAQPNLVFAAARWCGVPAPAPYAALRAALLGDQQARIAQVMMTRATQTNEAGRLATLMPFFVELAAGEPLALVEVGPSAGLCLYPDRYTYRYLRSPESADDAALSCVVDGNREAIPGGLAGSELSVAWRSGLDLNPLDVRDAGDVAWLEVLVWPEQTERLERLHRAVSIAQAEPPRLTRGNLLTDLDPLLDEAARHGTVVVFHTAVTAYVSPEQRAQFASDMVERVRSGRCHWISNEGANVHPEVTATGPKFPAGRTQFVLGVDGQARAWTHAHGAAMTVL